VTPTQAHLEPKVEYTTTPNALYTLIMYDPDALAGNYFHWVVINIPDDNVSSGQQLLNYNPPAPPQGTGIHRYIFLVFEQGGRINAQNIPDSKRTMSLNDLYSMLNTNLYLSSSSYFTCKNEMGGRRKRKRNDKTKKRRQRRKKSTKNR